MKRIQGIQSVLSMASSILFFELCASEAAMSVSLQVMGPLHDTTLGIMEARELGSLSSQEGDMSGSTSSATAALALSTSMFQRQESANSYCQLSWGKEQGALYCLPTPVARNLATILGWHEKRQHADGSQKHPYVFLFDKQQECAYSAAVIAATFTDISCQRDKPIKMTLKKVQATRQAELSAYEYLVLRFFQRQSLVGVEGQCQLLREYCLDLCLGAYLMSLCRTKNKADSYSDLELHFAKIEKDFNLDENVALFLNQTFQAYAKAELRKVVKDQKRCQRIAGLNADAAAQLLAFLEAEDSHNSSLLGASPSSSQGSDSGSLRSLGCNSPRLASRGLLPSFEPPLASGIVLPAVQQPLLSDGQSSVQDDGSEGGKNQVDVLVGSAVNADTQTEREREGQTWRLCRNCPKSVKIIAALLVSGVLVYGAYRVYLACV